MSTGAATSTLYTSENFRLHQIIRKKQLTSHCSGPGTALPQAHARQTMVMARLPWPATVPFFQPTGNYRVAEAMRKSGEVTLASHKSQGMHHIAPRLWRPALNFPQSKHATSASTSRKSTMEGLPASTLDVRQCCNQRSRPLKCWRKVESARSLKKKTTLPVLLDLETGTQRYALPLQHKRAQNPRTAARAHAFPSEQQ